MIVVLVMKPLTFLHCGHTPRCDATVDKRFDYFTLQLMTRGKLEVVYGAREYALHGGWLWTAYPGPHIRFHRAPGCASWHHRYAAFTGAMIDEWMAAGLWFEEPQPLPGEKVVALFDELLAQVKSEGAWSARRATNLLEQILLALAESRSAQPAREAWLSQVFERLNEDGNFAPDYVRLAASCGLGLSTLRRKFREATGTSLHAYVMQRRIAKARELLGETDWPLKQIASHLQFSDVYFFSSQFRKLAGIPPATYRKSRQV
jgi:AraC-like DNA-binding protein